MSPSPDELLMLLANNHGQPPPVENFTVEHKELGKIHWLVPVLPWKLDLDMVIKIGHLVVEVSQLSGTPGQGWSDAAVGRTAVGKMQCLRWRSKPLANCLSRRPGCLHTEGSLTASTESGIKATCGSAGVSLLFPLETAMV